MAKVWSWFGLSALTVFCMAPPLAEARGGDIDPEMAVKVILGEAADQGLEGMIAVAEVIRNRGKLEGFSAMRRDLDRFAAQQPKKVREMAKEAWEKSRHTNYTKGATHFENVGRFGMPYWAAGMIQTVKVADMYYFRKSS